MMKTIILIAVYLITIVIANLIISAYGKVAVLPVAFVFIGLDFTTRDYLHEIWRNRLWSRMLLLIGIGSILSYVVNHNAAMVAIASFVAFLSAGIMDTLIYKKLSRMPFISRINISNIFASFTDSALFISIAFGAWLPLLIFSQFAVKVFGGLLWSIILQRLGINEGFLRLDKLQPNKKYEA